MGRVVIPGFRKIETSGGGEGGTTNYEDLTNKPSINNVPLMGNLNTADLKLTDATLTEEGVPAESKTVGTKIKEINNQIDIEQYIIDQQEYKVVNNKVVPITDTPQEDYQGVSDFSDRNSKNINTIVTAHNQVVDNVADIRKDIKTLENYSTTETVIGKWGDEILCRKVITATHSITPAKEFSFPVGTITSDNGTVIEIKNVHGRAKGSVISEGSVNIDGTMCVGAYCNANYYCGCFMLGSSPDSISLLGKFGNSVNYVEVELCVEYTVKRI